MSEAQEFKDGSFSWFKAQCLSDRPTKTQSGVNISVGDTCNFGPFGNSDIFITELKKSIASTISGLFFWGRPTAVVFMVIAVVVNSIKSMAGWLFSHVSKEVFKFRPFGTNGNPSSSVIWVLRMNSFIAPRKHVAPCKPRWGFGHSVFKTILCFSRPSSIYGGNTSTRLSVAAFQMGCRCITRAATIAATFPYCISVIINADTAYSGKFAKRLTC